MPNLTSQPDHVQDHAEPETAEACEATAEAARAEADQHQAEAERLIETAQAEAARIVADAKQRAQDLTTSARRASARAEKAEERARLLRYTDDLTGRVRAAEGRVTALETEAGDLTARIADLDARLAELADRREAAEAALTAAREAGDVEAVTAHRAELSAVGEVAETLTGQRERAQERLVASGTERAEAVSAAGKLRAELEVTLDYVDPARIEKRDPARWARLLEATGGDHTTAAVLYHRTD